MVIWSCAAVDAVDNVALVILFIQELIHLENTKYRTIKRHYQLTIINHPYHHQAHYVCWGFCVATFIPCHRSSLMFWMEMHRLQSVCLQGFTSGDSFSSFSSVRLFIILYSE